MENKKLRVRTKSAHKSEIRIYNGAPRIFVDGEEVPIMGFQFFDENSKIFKSDRYDGKKTPNLIEKLHNAEIKLYYVRVDLGAPERFEEYFGELAYTIRKIRKTTPDARIISFVAVPPYDEFHEKYPDGVQTFDDGSVGGYFSDERMTMSDKETPRHSHASLEWRHETSEVLRQLVRRIQAEPDLDDAVIGYFIFPFHYEACYFLDYDDSVKLDDYSAATKLAMKNYLAEKYMGRVDWLREAWNDDTVDFENFSLPNRDDRTKTTMGRFWDPSVSQRVIDFAEIRSRVWADTLEDFCKACKEESGFRTIVGSFWGYLANNNTLWGGQSFFRRMLDSPYLDCWGCPFPYENKHLGCSITSRLMNDSIRMRGKMIFLESDTATSSTPIRIQKSQGIASSGLDEDAELLKRDFAYSLIESSTAGWLELNCGSLVFDENGLLPIMKQMQKIGRDSVGKPMGSVAEIASLVHQESLFCSPYYPNMLFNYTRNSIEHCRINILPYIGAPVAHYEMQDALVNDFDYKMYIFQNAWMLSEEERDLIHKNVEKDGRVLLYKYASGFLSPDSPKASADNITALTGIKMKEVEGPRSCRIVLTDAAKKIGLTPGDEIGEYDMMIESGMHVNTFGGGKPYKIETAEIDPVFVVDDPDAIVLGVYKQTGEPAFAMKNENGCTKVYIGSTCIDRCVMRSFARMAGVHLNTQEDSVIYENEGYMAVHAMHDGVTEINLRKKHALHELFTDEKIQECDRISLNMHKGETKLFELM